jgi:hypothetical protein
MTAKQLSAQIAAINNRLQAGKIKNPYAARFKVQQLQKQLSDLNRLKAWENYLSR